MEDKIICEFCKKNVSVDKLRKHLKVNHINEFSNLFELAKYVLLKKENVNDELLNQIINEYNISSVNHIEKKYGFRFRHFVNDLGLKKMSISDSKRSKITIEKTKHTNLMKYGVENVSNNESIKNKKKKTFLKNYGVDNIWKLRDYRIWWENEMINRYGTPCLSNLYGNENHFGWKTISRDDKNARIEKLHTRYKIWYNNLSEEERNLFNKNRVHKLLSYSSSNLEKRIENVLKNNGLNYIPQFWIKQKSYDFCLDFENKKILEVQGTYWHCDNRFYKKNDIVKHGDSTYLVNDIWNNDLNKKNIAESYGYKMYYIWEYDLNKMNDDEILTFLESIYEN